MALNLPVPEGGREGNVVLVADDGHAIGDPVITLAANGGSGAVTASQYGTLATQPTGATPYWMKIGKDSSGYNLFIEVFKGAVDA